MEIVLFYAHLQGYSRSYGIQTSPITQRFVLKGGPWYVKVHKAYFDEF